MGCLSNFLPEQADRACGTGVSKVLFVNFLFVTTMNYHILCTVQSLRLRSHAHYVTPPQAADEIIAVVTTNNCGRNGHHEMCGMAGGT